MSAFGRGLLAGAAAGVAVWAGFVGWVAYDQCHTKSPARRDVTR